MSVVPPLPPPPLTTPRSRGSRTKRVVIGGVIAIVVAIVAWIVGKGMYHNYRISSAAVERFHHELDQADYDAIWEDGTDALRASGTRVIKVFEMVHQKMGNSGKTNSVGFRVNWQSGGVYVSHTFDTAFSNGQGQESFVWVVEQDQARLQSYHIESPLLR
jgi:hypothetical protein